MPPIRFLGLSSRSAQIPDRLRRVRVVLMITCELHGPCQVSRGYRIGYRLSSDRDYIYLDVPAPCVCRLVATALMARGRWAFRFPSDSDD